MSPFAFPIHGDPIPFPGLTETSGEIAGLRRSLPREIAAFRYKEGLPLLWVVLLGGTGTGKSTVLNALCGREISEAGVERPKTEGPVVYVHEGIPVELDFPFPGVRVVRREEGRENGFRGDPGTVTVVTHEREEWRHLALVDTPDVDSVEERNRSMAEDLFLLADGVVYLTSQEKYADEVPSRYFRRIREEGKPHAVVLNKADSRMTPGEAQRMFDPSPVFLVPPVHPSSPERLGGEPSFREFAEDFSRRFGMEAFPALRAEAGKKTRERLALRLSRLLELLRAEGTAAAAWKDALRTLCDGISKGLAGLLETRGGEERKLDLQREIRKSFSRYDLLRGPRKIIREVLLFPLRVTGILSRERERRNEFREIRRKVDNSPIWNAVEEFQLAVLERLSPGDGEAPLFDALRRPGVSMSREEVEARVEAEQDRLASWLEETFRELSRGIPKTKEVGIYTTSVLWGAFLLSFEIVIGGGLSLLDAILGSFLAPYITKGSVELFAYREVRKVAMEMKRRYESGIRAIFEEQSARFEGCLDGLFPGPETLAGLEDLLEDLRA